MRCVMDTDIFRMAGGPAAWASLAAPAALRYFGLQNHADVVMFGHTHVPYLEKTDDLILLNPGSISKPRQDNKIPTYTVMEIREDGKIDFRMCEMPY